MNWILFDFESTGRHGSYLAEGDLLKLEEGQPFERTLYATDPVLFNDRDEFASDIHIEDTLGCLYRVRDARKLLREYQVIYRDEIEAWKAA